LGRMGKLKGKILAESRGGSVMRLVYKLVVFLSLAFFWASPTFGATITGSVTGPGGCAAISLPVVKLRLALAPLAQHEARYRSTLPRNFLPHPPISQFLQPL
jgi:hypothetical protein